jgi:hypothetical protein
MHSKLIFIYPTTTKITVRKIFGNAVPNYYLHFTTMTMPKSGNMHSKEQHEHYLRTCKIDFPQESGKMSLRASLV